MWYFRTIKRVAPTISFNGALSDYNIWLPSTSTSIAPTSISCNNTGVSRTRFLVPVSSGISQGQATIFNGSNNNAYVTASAEL
jgi:hypothetical protein